VETLEELQARIARAQPPELMKIPIQYLPSRTATVRESPSKALGDALKLLTGRLTLG
jgi:hypothetical protein